MTKNLINYGTSSFLFFCFEKENQKICLKRFDVDGFHAITSDKFVKRLLNEEEKSSTHQPIATSEAQDQQSSILKIQQGKSSRIDSHVSTPRLNSISHHSPI